MYVCFCLHDANPVASPCAARRLDSLLINFAGDKKALTVSWLKKEGRVVVYHRCTYEVQHSKQAAPLLLYLHGGRGEILSKIS